MSKYYNDTEYYNALKKFIDDSNFFVFSIQGRNVSKEEFLKHLKKIYEEKKTHADTIRDMALK